MAGEIKGAETILTYCMEHGVPRVVLYHDYEGVAKWATGEWKANKPGTIAYREFCRQAAEREVREELGLALDLSGVRPSVTVNFDGGFDDFFLVERDLALEDLTLQKEEVAQARWADLPEICAMADRGEFIAYPRSFLAFLFDMRGTFGFFTK